MFVAPTGLQLVIFLPQSPQCWADKGLAGPNYFKWKRTRLKMNTVNSWIEHFGLLPTSSRRWDTQCWIPSTLVSKWLGLSLCKEKYKLKGQDESLANVQISRRGQKRQTRKGQVTCRWLEASLDSARPCLREAKGNDRGNQEEISQPAWMSFKQVPGLPRLPTSSQGGTNFQHRKELVLNYKDKKGSANVLDWSHQPRDNKSFPMNILETGYHTAPGGRELTGVLIYL